MSGPYTMKRHSESAWTVVGPTETGWVHWSDHTTQQHADSLNAAYAAGQAGGGDRIAALEEAAKVAESHSLGETIVREMMQANGNEVVLWSVVSKRIAEAIRLLPPQTSTRDGIKESV
jgi:hypothetical protein